ncbi:hypothetical protein AZH46_11945 [Corynebacterium striatum]|uniref:Inorganic phosphate transporter n=1 Tax=Corynebacterium striatum TaxID=43770 RepID=A0ABC9ZNZ3_CORST|nr:hypothetical protein HMPREF0308_1273 [Corynebacterium striatum ATCC 6940]PIS63065.1 hypothetical protein AZH44_04745 [Corynebacterium striatum]PIS63218.1 hypothetical protein AZH47_03765 [Corynebacterium striatum]PIS66935.1 hypothetical protein AZH46_11945 [Corynebacterium striatum]GEA43671.1 hypothetical protein Cst04h_18410 [Corynebacterium striatum]
MHDNTVDLLRTVGMVMAASLLGLPVSSTHILIGAVLGVGIVNRAANWGHMKPIALARVITLPASAGIAAITVSVLPASCSNSLTAARLVVS